MYRRTYEELAEEGGVPSIPVQPISYGDAVHFMRWGKCGTVSQSNCTEMKYQWINWIKKYS